MDTLQAAILLSKMEIFADEVAARDRIGRRYSQLIEATFEKVSEKHTIGTPHIEAHNLSVYAQYTIEVNDRAKVEAGMKARGVPTAVHYPVPLHLQPVFGNLGHSDGDFPASEQAARRVLSLPMHPYLTEDQQTAVVQALFGAVTE
jgi:UDP-2-acetamido-2-deoxy-ribo-hexuluronate aminotransferase